MPPELPLIQDGKHPSSGQYLQIVVRFRDNYDESLDQMACCHSPGPGLQQTAGGAGPLLWRGERWPPHYQLIER